MKVVADLTRCQGYAQCAFAAPDVFTMRGDEALLYDPLPDDAQRARIVYGNSPSAGGARPRRCPRRMHVTASYLGK